MSYHLYTKDENDFLCQNYPVLGAAECASQLNLPIGLIKSHVISLGLRRQKSWDKHITSDTKGKVIAAYHAGVRITDIQEASGLSYVFVMRVLDIAGVEVEQRSGPKRDQLTFEEKSIVQTRWAEMATIESIAKEVGVSLGQVSRFAKAQLLSRDRGAVQRKNSHSRFTSEQIAEMVRQSAQDLRNAEDVAQDFGCSAGLVSWYVRQSGVLDGRDIRTEKMQQGYVDGRITVSPLSSRGVRTLSSTPFQGALFMRSRTEGQRANLFNSTGRAWFYEVQRYTLKDGRTYLPDFWFTDIPVEEARLVLGDDPQPKAIQQFLESTPHWVEETKGWFVSGKGNYDKVHAFAESGDCPRFSVLVSGDKYRQKNDRRLYGAVPDIFEMPHLRK